MPKYSQLLILFAATLFCAACSDSTLEKASADVLAARVQVNGTTPQIARAKTTLAAVEGDSPLGSAVRAEAIDQRLAAVAKRYSTAKSHLGVAEVAIKGKDASFATTVLSNRFAPEFKDVPTEIASLSGRLQLLTTAAQKRSENSQKLAQSVDEALRKGNRTKQTLLSLRKQYPTYAEKFDGLQERIASLKEALQTLKPKLKSAPLPEYILTTDRIGTTLAGLEAADKSVTQLREDLDSERIVTVSGLKSAAYVILGRSCWDDNSSWATEHITTFPPKKVPVEQFNYIRTALEGLKDGSDTSRIAEIRKSLGIRMIADSKLWALINVDIEKGLWDGGDDKCIVYPDDAYIQYHASITETVNGAVVHSSKEEVDEVFFKKTKAGDLLFKKSKGKLTEDAEIQKL